MVTLTGKPMLLLFSTSRDLIRTLPALQHDDARPEDVDSDMEDHAPTRVDTPVCRGRSCDLAQKQVVTLGRGPLSVHRGTTTSRGAQSDNRPLTTAEIDATPVVPHQERVE